MTEKILSLGAPSILVAAAPVYDSANLVLGVRRALEEFHKPWNARLGFRSDSLVTKEHWATIKALTRRLGVLDIDEYRHLRPVADLILRLQEEIGTFVLNPLRWDGPAASDDEKGAIVDEVKREVFDRLHSFCKDRLLAERKRHWTDAYAHRGPGSTIDRANDVRGIYEASAPIPGVMPSEDGNVMLTDVRKLVREAVTATRGRFLDS